MCVCVCVCARARARVQYGSNIGLRRSHGTLVAYLSFQSPPSFPLLAQIALKARSARLEPKDPNTADAEPPPPSPWFQSVADTVWLAEEEDASMWAEEGGGSGDLTHGCLPLSSLRAYAVTMPAPGAGGAQLEQEVFFPMAELEGREETWSVDAARGARRWVREGRDGAGAGGERGGGWHGRAQGRQWREGRQGRQVLSGRRRLGKFALLHASLLGGAGGLIDSGFLVVQDEAGASLFALTALQEWVGRLVHSHSAQVRVFKTPAATIFREFMSVPWKTFPSRDLHRWQEDVTGLQGALEAMADEDISPAACRADWGLGAIALPEKLLSPGLRSLRPLRDGPDNGTHEARARDDSTARRDDAALRRDRTTQGQDAGSGSDSWLGWGGDVTKSVEYLPPAQMLAAAEESARQACGAQPRAVANLSAHTHPAVLRDFLGHRYRCTASARGEEKWEPGAGALGKREGHALVVRRCLGLVQLALERLHDPVLSDTECTDAIDVVLAPYGLGSMTHSTAVRLDGV